jgi:sulfonate transport system permease protein
MSLIDRLPSVRSLRLPRADGLVPWIVPLTIVLIWQIACVTGFVPTRVLPAPSDVVLAGWKLLLSGELAHNIWVSFWRASVGFVIGGGIGWLTACRSSATSSPTQRCKWCATSRISP